MVKLNKGINHKEYVIAENNAHAELIKHGFTPQGADKGFKTVCVMKFEHPEFYVHPVKCGKREIFHFSNWQEALEELVNKPKKERN